ncbi:killer cell lectin-like receptor subfamily F member 1 [Lissotriton helveticus]
MEKRYQEYDALGGGEEGGQGQDPQASILKSSLRHVSQVDESKVSRVDVEGEEPSKMMNTVYMGVQRGASEDECTPQQAADHGKTHSTVCTSVSSRLLLPCPLCRLLLGALVAALLILLTVIVLFRLQSCPQTSREEERPSSSSNPDLHLNISAELRLLRESLKHLQEEICSPQEQTKCQLCPQNWVYNEEKCYYISQEEAPWDESRRHCTSRRSELAVIEEEGGKKFLDKQMDTAALWIGLRNENGTWRWVTGNVFTDRIDGAKGSCGTMNRGKVGSESCKNPNKWICVKNAADFPPPRNSTIKGIVHPSPQPVIG